MTEENSAKKKTVIAHDKWNTKWDKAYPWAEKLEADGQVRAFYGWCRDANRSNSMASCGLQTGRNLRLLSMRQLD